MARKSALTADGLKELGADKLALLVLDQAERDAGFRRQVSAALAGKSGPAAIAKVIDRRLSGLERARSFVDWDKTRSFRNDIQSLLDTLVSELGMASPVLAVDRLLRFIATHASVFERIDDSSGSVQDVYYQAIAATGDLMQQVSEAEADLLPEKIMAALGEAEHGYLADLTEAVASHLPQHTLNRWDADLAKTVERRHAEESRQTSEGWSYSMTSQWNAMRQIIAAAHGDLDLLIGLEAEKRPHMQDTLGIAARLVEAGRADEALDWVRRPGRYAFGNPGADDPGPGPSNRVSLEAHNLDALGDAPAAQALRWRCFETGLSADILREYLKRLPDFEDMEAEETALELALRHHSPDAALQFFLDWPRHDLAAQLIVAHHDHWDGGAYYILPKVAGLLEHEHPLAASILYRALLGDILGRARSKAYSHGAKYLNHLTLLADDANVDPARPKAIPNHLAYLEDLKKTHPRKSAFWQLTGGTKHEPDQQASVSRKPQWVREGPELIKRRQVFDGPEAVMAVR